MSDNDSPLSYDQKFQKAKELLDHQHEFPCHYEFKFIVPKDKEEEIRALFPDHKPQVRPSKKGNYLSLSFEYYAESSELVLAIYEKASGIQGLIAL